MGCTQHPIVLRPDDTASFASAPKSFDKKRQDILRGKRNSVCYYSKTVGNNRNLIVYTPPGYSTNIRYPVLYLLHGIAGDETEWYKQSSPGVILDNLIADRKIKPMIVVFPNGRAMKHDSVGGNAFDRVKLLAFANFEKDLLKDIIPFVEANYPVIKDRKSRALAGFSIGGGQALNIGLGNLYAFAWVGSFSPGGSLQPSQLIADPTEVSKKLKLLYISCGDKDDLLFVSQDLHAYLKKKNLPHVYQINSGGHSISLWANDLFLFTQLIFK